VVISGTLKPVSKLNSPVPVELYTDVYFKANPSPTIFESIQQVNGVRPQLNCSVCNTGDIHINGQEGSYTMVLIDGLPMVSGLSTVYGLTGIPQALIEQLELVKGPASTIYGSEAIGGLINLITKRPDNADRFSVDLFGTSWGELNTDIGYRYSLGQQATGLLGVSYFKYDHPIDKNGDGFTDLTLQDRISVFNKIDLGNKLSFATRYLYEDRWGGQLGWTTAYRGGDEVYGESIYTSRFELFGKYTFAPEWYLQFSFNDHYQHSAYGTTFYKASQSIAFGQFVWNKALDAHDLTLGLAYRYTFYDDNTTATFDEKSASNQSDVTNLPGLFVQDEIALNDRHTLLLGMRYDYNSVHGHITTPRVNYKRTSKDGMSTFRASIGSGYRVANVFTEDHAALTGAREVEFEEDLRPERSWNANLNYLQQLYAKNGSITEIDLSVFSTNFSNKIVPDYDTDPNKIIYGNLDGKFVASGASVNINSRIYNGFRLSLGMTYIDAYLLENGVRKTPYLVERFQGIWKLGYQFPKNRVTVDFTGNITGPMKLPLLGPLDPRDPYSPLFGIVNLQLTKKWKNQYELYGGVKNLLNFRPSKHSIARSFDPFDEQVVFDENGQVLPSPDNPYALSFDPSYVYASNQGIRCFVGFRLFIN
ncbi:MAG: TonB-dependent receptor, partial [Lutibacter sp.]|jgi:outer membrane receptor for ferrienterochelin and colicins|nr:TonB-dependent receptor [Lutibacter sp.]